MTRCKCNWTTTEWYAKSEFKIYWITRNLLCYDTLENIEAYGIVIDPSCIWSAFVSGASRNGTMIRVFGYDHLNDSSQDE